MSERLGRSPAQMFAFAFGAVYLLIGIAGFFVTGLSGFAEATYDDKLIVFPLNPLHNIVHLLIGVAWLMASATHAKARLANLGIGLVYGIVAIAGFFDLLEFLAISGPASADNFLHLLTSLLALYFGTAGAMGPMTQEPVS